MSAALDPARQTGAAAVQPDAAPMLPIEAPIVSAALAVERARSLAETALVMLRSCPRNEALVWEALGGMNTAVGDAFAAYSNYNEIRLCSGQA